MTGDRGRAMGLRLYLGISFHVSIRVRRSCGREACREIRRGGSLASKGDAERDLQRVGEAGRRDGRKRYRGVRGVV